MFLEAARNFLRALGSRRKRSLISLPVFCAGIVLGYHAFLAWLLSGFIIAKYFGGKATGKRGRIPSIAFPLRKRKAHLHHWLISSATMGLTLLTGTWFLPGDLFYGFGVGIAFQGIYCYQDWHKILFLNQ
ncbi:MAG: hypothetical protein KJ624_07690 [Chloroflexi bacterium]|nr:hypothetical protein [Chloroflexota bacterium]